MSDGYWDRCTIPRAQNKCFLTTSSFCNTYTSLLLKMYSLFNSIKNATACLIHILQYTSIATKKAETGCEKPKMVQIGGSKSILINNTATGPNVKMSCAIHTRVITRVMYITRVMTERPCKCTDHHLRPRWIPTPSICSCIGCIGCVGCFIGCIGCVGCCIGCIGIHVVLLL
jgi:hypothetical protein